MSRRTRWWVHAVSIICSAGFVLPLYWAFIASLGPTGAAPTGFIAWWPNEAQWQNYGTVFSLIPMWRYLGNSVLVVGVAVPLTVITASLAGFSLAQFPASKQRQLVIWSVVWLIIPNTAVWVFRFQIFKWLGIINTPVALIAPAVAASSPLYVLLYYWNARRIPHELFEAAQLAGAGAWRIWWSISRPLLKPTTIAVTVLSFTFYWSDFVSPTLYLTETSRYTAPLALQFLLQMDSSNWPVLMAAAMILLSPVLLLFICLQRFFLHDDALAQMRR